MTIAVAMPSPRSLGYADLLFSWRALGGVTRADLQLPSSEINSLVVTYLLQDHRLMDVLISNFMRARSSVQSNMRGSSVMLMCMDDIYINRDEYPP